MTADTVNHAQMEELVRLYPRAFSKPSLETLRNGGIGLAFAGLVVFCLWRMDFFNLTMIWHGVERIGQVLGFMFPPAAHGWFWEFLYGMLQTLAMAFLGTLLAALAAVPLGFLGAKNVAPHAGFHFLVRRLFDCIRGVDALIWALIFVGVVGLGPFAGILAIAVSDSGTLAKLFAEAIENASPRPVEGVKAAGADHMQTIRFGMMPQVLPILLSNSLYYFESNTRSATILGIVGAGGIGLHLSDRIRVNNWDEALFIMIMILVTVSLIDTLSRNIRKRFI